jgi:hypothetical protein
MPTRANVISESLESLAKITEPVATLIPINQGAQVIVLGESKSIEDRIRCIEEEEEAERVKIMFRGP